MIANTRPTLLVMLALMFNLFASPAIAAPWMQPVYLYRYFVWGAQRSEEHTSELRHIQKSRMPSSA